jgi:hypothetical protein
LKILHPICLKFVVIFLLFYTAAWSRQRPLSCCSWQGRNDFRLLINRTWKLLAKVFKWSPIVCLLLLTVMKNPEKYECGLRYPNAGDFRNFVVCAGDGRVGRYGLTTIFFPSRIWMWLATHLKSTQMNKRSFEIM